MQAAHGRQVHHMTAFKGCVVSSVWKDPAGEIAGIYLVRDPDRLTGTGALDET